MSKSISENVFLTRPLVLIGMMGAGKTSVGRELARLLKTDFIDADAEIEKAANMKAAEIFSRYGEAEFRRLERQVIFRLLDHNSCVLSFGGGAFVNDEIRACVKEKGFSVWIRVDREILTRRIKGGAQRPLLAGGDPEQKLKKILDEREPIYAEADLSVPCDDRPAAENALNVLDAVRRHERSPLLG